MARYGTLIAWAESIGHDDIVRLLNTDLNEEKAADRKLSGIALRKGSIAKRQPKPYRCADRSATFDRRNEQLQGVQHRPRLDFVAPKIAKVELV